VPAPARPRQSPPILRAVRRLLASDWVLGGILIVAVSAFVVWGAIRVFALTSTATPTATARSIADVLLATPSPTVTATPPPPSATQAAVVRLPSETPTLDPAIGEATAAVDPNATSAPEDATAEPAAPRDTQVRLQITLRTRAWLRISVDGKIVQTGRLAAGSVQEFSARQQVEILTADGAAVQVNLNGQDLGLMGGANQVVNLVYTAQGALNPTPTVTVTATITPRVPATRPPSATPTGSAATRPALP
jgi:hypothetical protein